MGWFAVAAVGAVLVASVVVARSVVIYRWPAFLRWRIAKSRRDRGKVKAEAPNPGCDPTSGVL